MLLSADMEAAGQEDEQHEEIIVGKSPNCDSTVSYTGSSSARDSRTSVERQDSEVEMTTIRRPTTNQTTTTQSQHDLGRRKVARFLNAASAIMTAKAHKQIEKTGFKPEAKTNYPETPGERYKNSILPSQIAHYQRSSTPDNRSRAESLTSRTNSDNGEGSSRPRSTTSHSVPAPAVSRPRSHQAHSNSLPGGGIFETSNLQCPPATLGGWQRQLSPFDTTSISRSRTPSISEVSPTNSSPGLRFPPEIVVSAHEGG